MATTTRARTTGTDDAVGEDEDEESSSSSSSPIVDRPLGSLFDDVELHQPQESSVRRTSMVEQPVNYASNVEDDLHEFRLRWKQELELSRRQEKNSSSPESTAVRSDAPTSLFRQGVAYEQRGLMHEAVRCYRQAIHLVPDIEKQFYRESIKNAKNSPADAENGSLSRSASGADFKRAEGDDGEESYENWTSEELAAYFETKLVANGQKVFCFEEKEQNVAHVSDLPTEVLFNVFKWVVSSDLDLRQLEQLSLVCRGFYVMARHCELWKLSCAHVWGLRQAMENLALYGTWRQMFVNRAHPWFNGLYISRISYIRHGEATFQDHNYRPWHLVVYYRYIRFFADGTILMVTTADEPQMVVPYLKTKRAPHNAALVGTFKFVEDDCIAAVLIRPKRNWNENIMFYGRRRPPSDPANESEQIFNVEFRLSDVKKRKNCCLNWLGYEISLRYRNGKENRSNFHLTDQNFPPLFFSRAKSYTTYSEACL